MADQDPLVAIDAVDWSSLEHAYGDASDIPAVLRRLLSSDHEECLAARSSLSTSIFHQGSRYSASAPAIPIICSIAAKPETVDRSTLVRFMTYLAIGDPYHRGLRQIDAKKLRADVVDVQRPEFAADSERDAAEYIEGAPDEAERARRKKALVFLPTPEETVKNTTSQLAVYDAARAQLGTLLVFLEEPTPAMRIEAAYSLAWFAEDVSLIGPALLNLLDREQDEIVRATALIALGLLHCLPTDADSPSKVVSRCQTIFLTSDSPPVVRWASAIAIVLIHEATTEHVHEVLRILTEPGFLEEIKDEKIYENWIPFAIPDLQSLAALVLENVEGADQNKVAEAIISALPLARGDTPVLLTEIALRLIFPRSSEPILGESLSEIQKSLVRALTRVDRFMWSYANFTTLLKPYGLPSRLAGMEALANGSSPRALQR